MPDVDSMMRLEDAMAAGGIAWWEMELPSGAVFFSDNKARMLGYPAEDFYHYEHFTKLVHPDDYESMMESMRRLMSGKAPVYETLYRIKAADGKYVRFFDRGKIVQRSGDGSYKIAGVVIRVDDIEPAIARTLAG